MAHSPVSTPSPDVLSLAAQSNRLDEVQRLLDQGACADVDPLNELPPLCWAAQHANAAMVDLLLRHGAAPDWLWHGHTVMHFAAMGGDLEITERLVDLGVPLDPANRQGARPSHHAAQKGQAAWLRTARALGAVDLDAGDAAGRTPLHWAVEANQIGAVRALLDAMVDLRRGDQVGRTAGQLAHEMHLPHLAHLIVGTRIARERTLLQGHLETAMGTSSDLDASAPHDRPSSPRARPRL